MLFSAFLGMTIGLLSVLVHPLLLLLLLPATFFLFRRREKGKLLALLLALGTGILLVLLFPKGEVGPLEDVFLVLQRKESYCLLLSAKGRYLCYDDGRFNLFSLVRIQGESLEFRFRHYEHSFDFEGYLRTRGVFHELRMEEAEPLFDSPLNLDGLKTYAFSFLEGESRSLVDSLLFGGSLADLSSYPDLADLGWTSLFALGGFHLSFLLWIADKVLGRKGRSIHRLFSLLLSFLFLILSLFRASMTRIFLLRALSLLNRRFKRKLPPLEILSLVALLFLLFNPYFLLSSSFAYSFPLLFLLRIFPRRGRGKGTFFLFLTLFFLPYRLAAEYEFVLLGPVLQFFLMPLSHLLFLLSLLLFLLPQIGLAIHSISMFILSLSKKVVSISPSFSTGRLPILFFVLFYLLFFLFLLFGTYRIKKYSLLSLLGIGSLLGLSVLPDFSNHEEIHFIDVGQGDATLVRHGRSNLLIDTGGDVHNDLATDCLIPYFQSLKITRIDAVLITHYDFDHYGALESLRRNFPVGEVLDVYDFLEDEDGRLTVAGLEIENLNLWGEGDSNSQSAVFSFALGEKEVLIMGDAPRTVEAKIMERFPNLECDVLRLGHHGSKTSSDPIFLSFLDPEVGILSVGVDNPYGHPDSETIQSLEQRNIPYRRTDEDGTIAFRFSPTFSIMET